MGGGLILNGEIYEGYALYGGELAYTTVYNEALGEYGFLRDVTSMDGIRAYVAAKPEEAASSSIAKHFFDDTFYLDMMIEAARTREIRSALASQSTSAGSLPLLLPTSHIR